MHICARKDAKAKPVLEEREGNASRRGGGTPTPALAITELESAMDAGDSDHQSVQSKPSRFRKAADLSGSRYGRLAVDHLDLGRSTIRHVYWHCRCDCGTERSYRSDVLTRGVAKSCGCLAKELIAARSFKHGACLNGKTNGDAIYATWKGMKQRCLDVRHPAYKHYGGAGIVVCSRWLENFQAFLEDMGERPIGFSLDRIDPFENYEPSNCRWADAKTQARNQKRFAGRVWED